MAAPGQAPTGGPRAARPGPLADSLRVAVMRTARRLRAESSTEQVTAGQFSVLTALKHGPATLRELAEREQVQPPSMTRTVAALVEQGLLERTEDDGDRRRVYVALTPAGRTVIAEARSRRTEWLAGRLADLSADERGVLAAAAEILHRISRA